MKPDKFDIKIQQAAAQYESVYNEEAWDAMEKLLDEKMPQKKDKRKIFWIFFFSLLFLGTGSLLFMHYTGGDTQVVSIEKDSPTASTNNAVDASNAIIKNAKQEAQPSHQPSRQPAYTNSFPKKSIKGQEIKTNNRAENTTSYSSNKDVANNYQADHQSPNVQANDQTEQRHHSQSIDNIKRDSVKMDKQTDADEENNLLVKNNDSNISNKKISGPKRKNKFINSFALSLSAGPDVSAVELSNMGKINLVYGAGISYQLSKRLTLRTGFYIEQKVYDAGVPDYHPPARFWNYYPDLKYIDADCKIYEVPLIVNYNFSQTPKYNWFGAVGVSSFFMKKEDYNFFSKNPSGQTSYNNYTIDNKNKHYLSSVRLSAGYQRKINNNISILAEPYLNVPLTGVGYGKVKLYSTGILLTVSMKPFAQKK